MRKDFGNLRKGSRKLSPSPLPITISTRADGRYVDANEAFLRMMGRPWEEIVGHTVNELNVWAVPVRPYREWSKD